MMDGAAFTTSRTDNHENKDLCRWQQYAMYCTQNTVEFANVLMLKYLHIITTLKILKYNLYHSIFHFNV